MTKARRRLSWVLAASLAATSLHAAAPPKPGIAVKDLRAEGIDEVSASIISERIRSELINTGAFRVLTLSEMHSILKAKGFQKSGACDDQQCLAQAAKALGVDRIVAGSVGMAGNMCRIGLHAINAATGETMLTVTEDCDCANGAALTQTARNIAVRLAQGTGPQAPGAGAPKAAAKEKAGGPKVGGLSIVSGVPGASLELDGKQVPGVTPLVLQGIAAGEHRIVARKEACSGALTVNVAPDSLLKVSVEMGCGSGSVRVSTQPADARVLVDGVDRGATPLKIDSLAAGNHQVRIVKKGYLPRESAVAVHVGKISSVSENLVRAAYLTVRTPVAGAVVQVNGKDAGKDSVCGLEVPAGATTVQVEAPGYDLFRATIKLAGGETKTVDAALEAKFGGVKVASTPKGAAVYLNDKEVGSTPYADARLKPGAFRLKLRLADHDSCDTAIQVVRGKTADLSFKLGYRYAALKVASAPPGASVSLNDTSVGVTPYTNPRLTPGTYRLALRLADHDSCDTTLSIARGKTADLSLRLASKHGTLIVATTPPGANVFLNKTHCGPTPYSINWLDPGAYELHLELATYDSVNEWLTIVKDDTLTRSYSLKHSRAYLDSLVVAKKHARKHLRIAGRIVCGTLGAAAAGTGYLFNTRVAQADQAYHDYHGDDAGIHADNWQAVKDNQRLRNVLYSAAGVLGGVFLVLWIPF